MIHLGDITKLNGAEMPVVDVITGGSPCQDLSVAGTRSGLDGERSGLFMEQIRIIKEMRKKDAEDGRAAEFIRPRWMVWENVIGALSSSGKGQPKGADFQRVLTEIVRVIEPNSPDVPMPDKGWPKAGCIYDDMGRWSISWRVTDAQFFGLAQRRRRIALVADFAGLQAPEVLFDPQYRGKAEDQEHEETVGDTGRRAGQVRTQSESLYRNSDESAKEGEGTSGTAEGSTDKPIGACIPNQYEQQGKQIDAVDVYNQSISGEVAKSLNSAATDSDHIPCVMEKCGKEALSFQERAGKPGGGKGILIQHEHTGALVGQNVQSVVAYGVNGDIAGTLDASYYKGCGQRQGIERDVVAYGISPFASNAMLSDNPHSGVYEADTSRTLDLNGGTPSCNQGGIAIVTVDKQNNATEEGIITFPIEGNGQRESHRGDGYGKANDPSFTLNTTEQHGVAVTAAGFKPRQSAQARTLGFEEEVAPTISTDQNYATIVSEDENGI